MYTPRTVSPGTSHKTSWQRPCQILKRSDRSAHSSRLHVSKDLYQVYRWDTSTDGEVSLETLDAKMSKLGYIRVISRVYSAPIVYPSHSHSVFTVDAFSSGRSRTVLEHVDGEGEPEEIYLSAGDALALDPSITHRFSNVPGGTPLEDPIEYNLYMRESDMTKLDVVLNEDLATAVAKAGI